MLHNYYAGAIELVTRDSTENLKGTSLDVYCLLLKSNKPLGIREIQRELKLSSPSVAQYHLTKLEHSGLLKKERGSYSINRVVLENHIKISRFLVPRYLFYSIFAAITLLIELTALRPAVLDRNYVFFTSTTLIFVLIFSYETVKVWLKDRL